MSWETMATRTKIGAAVAEEKRPREEKSMKHVPQPLVVTADRRERELRSDTVTVGRAKEGSVRSGQREGRSMREKTHVKHLLSCLCHFLVGHDTVCRC